MRSLQSFRKFFIEFQLSSLFPKIARTAFRTWRTASGGFMNARIFSIFFLDRPLTAVLAYYIKGKTFYNCLFTTSLSLSIFISSTDKNCSSFYFYALLAEASCIASVILSRDSLAYFSFLVSNFYFFTASAVS